MDRTGLSLPEFVFQRAPPTAKNKSAISEHRMFLGNAGKRFNSSQESAAADLDAADGDADDQGDDAADDEDVVHEISELMSCGVCRTKMGRIGRRQESVRSASALCSRRRV